MYTYIHIHMYIYIYICISNCVYNMLVITITVIAVVIVIVLKQMTGQVRRGTAWAGRIQTTTKEMQAKSKVYSMLHYESLYHVIL